MAYLRNNYLSPTQGQGGGSGPPVGSGTTGQPGAGPSSYSLRTPGGGGSQFVNLQDLLDKGGAGDQQYQENAYNDLNNRGADITQGINHMSSDFQDQIPHDYQPNEGYAGPKSLQEMNPDAYSQYANNALQLGDTYNTYARPGGIQAAFGGGAGSGIDAAMMGQYQPPAMNSQYSNLWGTLNSANEDAKNLAGQQPGFTQPAPVAPPVTATPPTRPAAPWVPGGDPNDADSEQMNEHTGRIPKPRVYSSLSQQLGGFDEKKAAQYRPRRKPPAGE